MLGERANETHEIKSTAQQLNTSIHQLHNLYYYRISYHFFKVQHLHDSTLQ